MRFFSNTSKTFFIFPKNALSSAIIGARASTGIKHLIYKNKYARFTVAAYVHFNANFDSFEISILCDTTKIKKN